MLVNVKAIQTLKAGRPAPAPNAVPALQATSRPGLRLFDVAAPPRKARLASMDSPFRRRLPKEACPVAVRPWQLTLPLLVFLSMLRQTRLDAEIIMAIRAVVNVRPTWRQTSLLSVTGPAKAMRTVVAQTVPRLAAKAVLAAETCPAPRPANASLALGPVSAIVRFMPVPVTVSLERFVPTRPATP